MPLALLELKGNDYQNFASEHENVGEKLELSDEGQTYGTMENTKVRNRI